MTEGVYPYCAMMQVAAEDTCADYVICRGFDTRIRKFIDYAESDPNNPGIPVAKPYGKRQTGQYEIGQVFAALLPLQTGNPSPTDAPIRFGQNPGVAAVSQGHPADLDEDVEILYTDDGKVINWLLVDAAADAAGDTLVRFELIDDMFGGECTRAFQRIFVDDDEESECGYWETDTSTIIWVQDPARKLCGWGGWIYDGGWQRPTWAGSVVGSGSDSGEIFDEGNCGSIGLAYLPSDATATAGSGSSSGSGSGGTGGTTLAVHEIVWMVEPCEMFYAEVADGVEGTDPTIPLTPESPVPMQTSRNQRFWQNTPPTSVENVFNWYVASGAFIICARKSCHNYYPVQVSCPPIFSPP